MTIKLDDIMDQRLAQLDNAKQKFDKMNKVSVPKIQKIPVLLRQNERFAMYCSPKMISFGPIHHNKEDLKQAEDYKLLWTSKFVAEHSEKQVTDQAIAKALLERIEDNIEELKNQFSEDLLLGEMYDDKYLAWMLFVDGCSLLYFMEYVDINHPEALNIKLDQLTHMWRDSCLLENQLPRRLLEMLSKTEGTDLEYLYYNHLSWCTSKREGSVRFSVQNPKPIHILDFCRSYFLSPQKFVNHDKNNQIEINEISNQQNDDDDDYDDYDDEHSIDADMVRWHTCKNIRDLKIAGIRMLPNLSCENPFAWNNIHFTSKWFSGELRLPMFVFTNFTPCLFRNLVAYEMCPDVCYKYECCSFFSFMDSLIDTAEDVKELRISGVFQNLLGSDEDLANLFNELGYDLPTKVFCENVFISTNVVAFSKKYIVVKQQIEKHCANKWKTWLAEGYNTHFDTPWTMVAFLAALLALSLTFIQTWFSIPI
ncbi:UPF0481 protein At3g47200-like [Vigna unguiculata]|uniref:UPF0481 protein At3g47200-like n=1 Tax=Vigna unguiculata TaxID=3917 RepID=UPI00101631D8|nr:UPF0481 protein At3g47200-like [Vigna unguiculata]XP_027934902.1 UPF0481 protein At3g47200-like [Vigna unguiculata]XP_027934903.1 UPF0481 protein At3g47200-like [Vigna unguiculata]XP_027934904.1 UPF0481 protein At3g47200-like [Vigna unguiculata]XP_027934905.1 UPF0481 protein At3g47200-like [Vigna unguiculata]XP_027934907.1 UPF0481 protein At3g47200-like [Vigna unguiculata]XP_027934908.1 UPF0481 protein At3g47200-like [Vigna unguiculata]